GEHPIEARERLLVAPQPLQRVAAVVQRIDEIRLACQSPVEACERLLVAAQRIEDQPVVRESARRPRIAGERRANKLECLVVATLLVADDAEQVTGIEMVGLRPQNLQIERFGLRQLPPLMTADRAVEHVLQGGRSRTAHARRYSAGVNAPSSNACTSTAKLRGGSPRRQMSHIVV